MSNTTPGAGPERADGSTGPIDDGARDEPTAADTAAAEPVDVVEASEPAPAPVATEPPPLDEPDDVSSAPVAETGATSRLDEAVERANADAAASETDGIDETDVTATPVPVAADAVRRETYVPAATVATGTAAGAATLAPEPEPVYVAPQPAPQTIYVQAPEPPKTKGNRGFGALVALVGAVIFALLYAGVGYLLLLGLGGPAEADEEFLRFVSAAVYWVPIVAVFLGFTVLAAIVNRGPYWAYAVFGLLVAVFVYFAYLGGALLTVEAWTLTVDEASAFISERWLDPFAIAAAVIAREVPVWLGGWIAARGRTVTERNRVAVAEYERELAAGPQVQRY